MSAVEKLLERLEGVRRTGEGRWIAKCPAHGDRSPSLSIRATGDGTILLHDFAGCGALEVVHAVGLELADLFPERIKPRTPAERRAARRDFAIHSWQAALGVIVAETGFVEIIAHALDLPELNSRLALTCQRLEGALAVLRP